VITSGQDLTQFNEGLILEAKADAQGKWSMGWGCDYWSGKPVVDGMSCTKAQADAQFLMSYSMASSRAATDISLVEYAKLSPRRRAVLNDMAFEIGMVGLAQFKGMLAAIKQANWQAAADCLKASLLFSQVPGREARNMQILLTDEWPRVTWDANQV
jgi:GH24 family phage-related lysozyme (muramidase)